MIFSRFGIIAEAKMDVGLEQVLTSEAVAEADVVILDSASALMPDNLDEHQRFDLMQRLRKITSEGRSVMLCVDPDEMNHKLLHNLRASAEVCFRPFDRSDWRRFET